MCIERAEKKSNFAGICLERLNTTEKNSDSRSWLDKCCLYCYLIGWIYAVPQTAGENDKGFVNQVDDPVLDWDIGLQIKKKFLFLCFLKLFFDFFVTIHFHVTQWKCLAKSTPTPHPTQLGLTPL